MHEIHTAFDNSPTIDVRGVLFDISKAFGEVWHGGLLFKLQEYWVEGELLGLNRSNNREQRVVLNGQMPNWRKMNSGVTRGLVSGARLFLIFIIDLPGGITSICKILANDTSLFSKVLDIDKSAEDFNSDLEKISQWPFQWFNGRCNKSQ